MLAGTAPCDVRNVASGSVFNDASHAHELYPADVTPDYRGDAVTVDGREYYEEVLSFPGGLKDYVVDLNEGAEPLLERQHTPLGAPPAHALARHLLGDALPLLARRAQVVEAAQERSGRGGQHHHICWR